MPWRTITHCQNAIGATNFVSDGNSLEVSNATSSVKFWLGRKKCEVNGVTVWLNSVATGNPADGSWRMNGRDFDLLHLGILSPKVGTNRTLRVMVDAGHGGSDGGAVSRDKTLMEKDVTLSIARELGALLATNGFTVCYTRTNDVDVSLSRRVQLASENATDIFVSVHVNKAKNTQACGIETYLLPSSGFPGTAEGSSNRGWQPGNRNDYFNVMLGYLIQRRLIAGTVDLDRGLKRQSFYVLRGICCPAVLVEVGFLSNQKEAADMTQAEWRRKKAEAIYRGIADYAVRMASLEEIVEEKRRSDEESNRRWRAHLEALRIKQQSVVQTETNAPVTVSSSP
ncbi:MAG: N-acetylmuramoyl-L-alanine amidase, partial [Kiritimatiellae bacterium]|nr:N-acetylmuramoyl-L-alanine amidase [Kiritimatiellia bacterium]